MSKLASSAENFSKNFRRSRKNHKPFLSQKDIADQIGVTQNYVGMLERGERKPSLDALDAIAEVLGVKPYRLVMPPEELKVGERNLDDVD